MKNYLICEYLNSPTPKNRKMQSSSSKSWKNNRWYNTWEGRVHCIMHAIFLHNLLRKPHRTVTMTEVRVNDIFLKGVTSPRLHQSAHQETDFNSRIFVLHFRQWKIWRIENLDILLLFWAEVSLHNFLSPAKGGWWVTKRVLFLRRDSILDFFELFQFVRIFVLNFEHRKN